MNTWADAKKGDRVRAGGKVFTVAKIKGEGKKRDVRLEGQGARLDLTVKAKAPIDLVASTGKKGGGVDFARIRDLHDRDGRQQRWATKAEEREAAKPLLSPGNPAVAAAPDASGPKWSKSPKGDAEAAVVEVLGGELIAEGDPAEGYYVPPVAIDTVQAHLVIFHGRDFLPESPVTALADHDAEHRAAEAGTMLLPINHWHTERRPKP